MSASAVFDGSKRFSADMEKDSRPSRPSDWADVRFALRQ
jgi:hypothetical protein